MKEPESKPNYWSVVGLLLWSAVILVIFAGAGYLVGHFIFGRWWSQWLALRRSGGVWYPANVS